MECSPTECKDKNGNIVNSRPENVVDSYAVYNQDGKTGNFSKIGGKNYQTGKAFHIYRPQIIDVKGNKTWGRLRVDKLKGQLSVEVDKDWLASATYPVTVDPTFGYASIGASSISLNGIIHGSYWAISDLGSPTSISAYIYVNGASCFTGETLITMSDGSYKKIKDIELGDDVRSYSPLTKQIVTDTVTRLFHHKAEEMGSYYLVITTDNGKSVEVTPNHRVYLNGGWIEAGFLKVGDKLLSDNNQLIIISKIVKVYKKVPTYNLEIKNNHVYFANFLVHNAKASFLKGAKITLADSSIKNVEDIRIGDSVSSYDFIDKKIVFSTVTDITSKVHTSYLQISDSLGVTLKVTPTHPLFVNRKWVLAQNVHVGDKLFTGSAYSKVTNIEVIKEEVQAYNFTTTQHNYFVDGKLVSDESVLSEYGDISSKSKILTEIGYINIEDVKKGDKVFTYDPTTYKTNLGEIKNITKGLEQQPLFTINNALSLTPEASLYIRNGEKKVKDLIIGDELISSEGNYVPVFSIQKSLPQNVYALEITSNHNVYVDGYLVHNGTGYAKTAIYKQSDNTQVITSAEDTFITTGFTTSWQTFTITGSPNLTATTNYWLYVWGNIGTLTNLNIYYDSGGNGVNKTVTYGTWPDPLTGQTTNSRRYSAYVTYDVVPTPTFTPTPTPIPAVKFNRGVNILRGTTIRGN